MEQYESYNASYSLAYYNLGTIYAFYYRANSPGVPAPQNYIERYRNILDNLNKSSAATKSVIKPVITRTASGGIPNLSRVYAVVVDKLPNPAPHIVVMLQQEGPNGIEYFVKNYTVSGESFNFANDLQPESFGHLPKPAKGKDHIGDITRIKTEDKIGKITRSNPDNAGKSIEKTGDVTRMKKEQQEQKTGGVTRSTENGKVGGITRTKK